MRVSLKGIAFEGDDVQKVGVTEFQVAGERGSATVKVVVPINVINDEMRSVRVNDEVDVVRIAMRELHEFATRLSEETKASA